MSSTGSLRERDQSALEDGSPPPPSPRRIPRWLALALAVAALVAFAALARPQASPSARLVIGESESDPDPDPDADADTGPATERATSSTGPSARGFLRPLDPATLADVAANLLPIGSDQWPRLSEDADLLTLPDLPDGGGGQIRVVDARTLQPVAGVDLGGVGRISGLLGLTAESDAVVVELGGRSPTVLTRLPLDPEEPSTAVELPEGTERAALRDAQLRGGRVAMLVVEGAGTGPGPARVVVADLLAERVVVDLAVPGLQIERSTSDAGVSSSEPGVAWDTVRERLYIIHADSARVTVVDLAAGAILAEAEVGTPLPGLGQQSAQRLRWGQLSPDGSRLYVTGAVFQVPSGSTEPFGMSVVDTASLTEVGRVEEVNGWAQLSPDGRWLLWSAPDEGAWILDARELGAALRFGERQGGSVYPAGFSRDSSQVYLQSEQGGRALVVAYALPSLDETGERLLPRDAWFDALTGLLQGGG